MAQWKIKPTVTFTSREQWEAVSDAVNKCFDELDPAMCPSTFIKKNKSERYVVGWQQYKGFNYVSLKIIKQLGGEEDAYAAQDNSFYQHGR